MKIKAERELEGGVETEIGRDWSIEIGRDWSIEWGEDLRGQNNWEKKNRRTELSRWGRWRQRKRWRERDGESSRERWRGIEEEWSSINNCAEVGDAGGQQFSPNTVIIANELRRTATKRRESGRKPRRRWRKTHLVEALWQCIRCKDLLCCLYSTAKDALDVRWLWIILSFGLCSSSIKERKFKWNGLNGIIGSWLLTYKPFFFIKLPAKLSTCDRFCYITLIITRTMLYIYTPGAVLQKHPTLESCLIYLVTMVISVWNSCRTWEKKFVYHYRWYVLRLLLLPDCLINICINININ